MVEKFKNILKRLEEEKGKITLFAIIKTDDLADKWSVVLCAPWISSENRNDVFRFVSELMASILTPEENSTIARIGMFEKNAQLTQLLLSFRSGFDIKEETKVNGFVIHEGYIFASNPEI